MKLTPGPNFLLGLLRKCWFFISQMKNSESTEQKLRNYLSFPFYQTTFASNLSWYSVEKNTKN